MRHFIVCAVVLSVGLAGSPALAQIDVTADSPAADSVAVTINSPSPSLYNGFEVDYPNIVGTTGVQLMGIYSGGLNVGDSTGSLWEDVNASAFNVSSDLRLKKDVVSINANNAAKYVQYLRNIETATFRFKWEQDQPDSPMHIGVIAQSLPRELQAPITENPSGINQTGEEFLAARLADWVGLLTVCLQDAERRISELEAELAAAKGVSLSREAEPKSKVNSSR